MLNSMTRPTVSLTHVAVLSPEIHQRLINQDPDFIVELLLHLNEGISLLSSDDWDDREAKALLDTFVMLAHLKEPVAFSVFLKLLSFDGEDLEAQLGEYFLTEDLPYLLAATAKGRWNELQILADDMHSSQIMRIVALEAMGWMVVDDQLDRKELIQYFKASFQKTLEATSVDSIDELIEYKLSICTSLWPGECLEEIKELFAWNLIGASEDIHFVLTTFNKGLESCLDSLHEQWKNHRYIMTIEENQAYVENCNDIFADENFIEEMQEVKNIERSILAKRRDPNESLGRNDLCKCGSGKKFKKCCNNKCYIGKINLEVFSITSKPLEKEYSFPDHETPSLIELHEGSRERPADYLEDLKRLIANYPNVTCLYNYLYIAYMILGNFRQAHQILVETHHRFPNYLFALVELGMISLRRGEPERALEVLGGCHTLKQLYPMRNEFHTSEVITFSYFMACYSLDVDHASQAAIHLGILERIAGIDSLEVRDIRKRIKRYAAKQVLRKTINSS